MSEGGRMNIAMRMKIMKEMLTILGDDEWRWTKLQNQTIRKGECSAAQVYFTLKYMIKNGWCKKIGRGKYKRTDKGKTFLDAL